MWNRGQSPTTSVNISTNWGSRLSWKVRAMRLEPMGLPDPVHGFRAHADHGSQDAGCPVRGRRRRGGRSGVTMRWIVAGTGGVRTSSEMSAAFRVYTGSSSTACPPADGFLRHTAKTKPTRPVPMRSREVGSGALAPPPLTKADEGNVGAPPLAGTVRPPMKVKPLLPATPPVPTPQPGPMVL